MAPLRSSSTPIIPTYISGTAQPTKSSELYPVINARRNETVFQYHSSSPADATAAASASLETFQPWKRTSAVQRSTILLKVVETYENRIEQLAQWQDEETSCGLEMGRFQVKLACGLLRGIAAAAVGVEGSIAPSEDGTTAFVFKEAIGPVLVIAPWNGPLILCSRAIATVVAAGCTVVLKASELCPRSHHAIVEIFEESGLPKGVINQIQARREDAGAVTEAVVAHPAIRKVEFIGSATVGKLIGQLASKYLKPVLLELGGKGPALVLDDADLEKAAELCARGALAHHGQLCFSTERVIVHRSIEEPFKKLLIQAFANQRSTGTAASAGFAKHAYDFLEDAKANGAEFIYGGPEYLGPASLKPTIVTKVSKDALMRDQETFGPSVSLYVAEDANDAIKQANDSAYGLNAAIHTKDIGRALRIGRELEYAAVHVNSITPNDQPGWPVGGVKGSGWGRANARWGLHEFLADKLIAIHEGEPSFGK